jgi:hypothetical protein
MQDRLGQAIYNSTVHWPLTAAHERVHRTLNARRAELAAPIMRHPIRQLGEPKTLTSGPCHGA